MILREDDARVLRLHQGPGPGLDWTSSSERNNCGARHEMKRFQKVNSVIFPQGTDHLKEFTITSPKCLSNFPTEIRQTAHMHQQRLLFW